MPEDHGADTPDLQLRKPDGPLLAPSGVSVKDLPRSISALGQAIDGLEKLRTRLLQDTYFAGDNIRLM